ncbi:hypothetical protein [Thermodesulfobium sp.]
MGEMFPSDKEGRGLKRVEEFQYQDDFGDLRFKYIVINKLDGRVKLFFFELLILYFLPMILSLFPILRGSFLVEYWAWSLLISFVIVLVNRHYKIGKVFNILLFLIFYFTISILSIFLLVFSSFFYLITSFVTLFFKF